jgi:hypothetical protein
MVARALRGRDILAIAIAHLPPQDKKPDSRQIALNALEHRGDMIAFKASSRSDVQDIIAQSISNLR